MEKDIPCKWKSKEAGVAILISDKIDFKIKTIKRDKEGHHIMIKGSIQEEDITTVNIYAPNIGAPQYIRQILTAIKEEIDSNTIIVRDFFFFLILLIYLFMAVLGLRFCPRAFSSCGKRGPLFIAVCGPLTIAVSLVAEHRLQTCRLSNCGSRA